MLACGICGMVQHRLARPVRKPRVNMPKGDSQYCKAGNVVQNFRTSRLQTFTNWHGLVGVFVIVTVAMGTRSSLTGQGQGAPS